MSRKFCCCCCRHRRRRRWGCCCEVRCRRGGSGSVFHHPRSSSILDPNRQLRRCGVIRPEFGFCQLLFFINYALFATYGAPLAQYFFIAAPTALARPAARPTRPIPTDLLPRLDATNLARRLGVHEAAERDQGCPDPPCRLPRLLVVAADAEADLAIDLEAARRCQEPERRRPQRVGRWQHDAAVVDPTGVRACGGAGQREVPVQHVIG